MHAKSTFTGIKQFVVLNYGRKELTSLALFLVFAKVQLKIVSFEFGELS